MNRRDFLMVASASVIAPYFITSRAFGWDLEKERMLSVIASGLSKTSKPKHVVVAGAGMAGLVAAYELKRAGHEVTVLETSRRVGGRV